MTYLLWKNIFFQVTSRILQRKEHTHAETLLGTTPGQESGNFSGGGVERRDSSSPTKAQAPSCGWSPAAAKAMVLWARFSIKT